MEECGAERRIEAYYLPLLERLQSSGRARLRILDCGCGNGVGVDRLNELGMEAWGTDASALRKHQWTIRRFRERFFIADGLALPAPESYFDVVIASGVLEHIGVVEERNPNYKVTPLRDRDALRARFLSELLRVTRPGGTIWIDFPNGSFPIDFWHGERPGGARWHYPGEGFLPRIGELRRAFRLLDPSATLAVRSSYRRLALEQVGLHWYGRLFRGPARLFLRATRTRLLIWLSSTPLNPYVVLEVRKGC
jgi:SAM-dependent methyltransferase